MAARGVASLRSCMCLFFGRVKRGESIKGLIFVAAMRCKISVVHLSFRAPSKCKIRVAVLRVCYLSQRCSKQQQPDLISGETCFSALRRVTASRKTGCATCGKSSVLHVFAFGGLKRGGEHQGLIFAEACDAKSQTCI